MTRRVTFTVSFDRPDGCTVAEAQETLRNHLSSMGGDLRPPGGFGSDDSGDPMFGMDRSTIKVTRQKKRWMAA